MHAQITVIGPIASGKTTASRLIADHFTLPLLDADLFEQNPFLPSYVADTPRWAFATELFFTIHRIKKLRVLPRMLKKSSVVVDSGLIMSHEVYTKNHFVEGTMTASEWDFFNLIVGDYTATVPKPNIVVYLTASVPVQYKRIAQRGRDFEAGYTKEYLGQISDRLSEYAESISHNGIKLLTLSTEKYDLVTEKGKTALLDLVTSALGR